MISTVFGRELCTYKYVCGPVDIYLDISTSSTPLQMSLESRVRLRAPKSIQYRSWCQVCAANGDVVDGRVVLCYIVAFVFRSRHPIMPKFELSDTIAKPMQTYVHGIRPFVGDCVVHHAEGRGVICLERDGGLGMAHFGECVLGGDFFTEVDVQGANFGFGRG